MKSDFKVVIIGSGIAGMTAAIYLKRDDIDVCLLEKNAPGGLLNITSTIENYPGINQIKGPELALRIFEQVNELKIPFKSGNVKKIELKGNKKLVITDNEEISCEAVIIATGREAKKLNVSNVDELTGKGISYCALCDGSLYKGKAVAVVGGGNSALEESLYLANICKKVYIIVRKDKLSGDDVLIDEVRKAQNIKIIYNCQIIDFIKKDNILESIDIKVKDKIKNIKVSATFVFIGYKPATSFLDNLEITNKNGYVEADESRRTKINKIYAAGDVVDKEAFQLVTASSDGAIAAVSCLKDIEK